MVSCTYMTVLVKLNEVGFTFIFLMVNLPVKLEALKQNNYFNKIVAEIEN